MHDPGNGYDPVVAFLGSVMFCAIPLYYFAFWTLRKLRWKSLEIQTLVGGLLVGFGLFTFFLTWLGPMRGLFFAIAALLGWSLGAWHGARRNELVVRNYYDPPTKTKHRNRPANRPEDNNK